MYGKHIKYKTPAKGHYRRKARKGYARGTATTQKIVNNIIR